MPFYLWKAVLGRWPRIEIAPSEHESIVTAWRALAAALDIEENWESVVQSYIELETALVQSALHSMVLNRGDYHEYHDARTLFSRRLSNLLQSCRSYLDHTPHSLSSIGSPPCEDFRAFRHAAYGQHFGYRFMEALRNHAQHRSFPLHGTTFSSDWTGDFRKGDKGFNRYSVGAVVNVEELRRDKKFSKKVLSELRDQKSLDVGTLAREYLEGLGSVHDKLRRELAQPLTKWKSEIRCTIERYAAANDGNVLGLCVAEFDARDTVTSKTSIFESMLDRLEKLTARNGNLANLTLRFVSSEAIGRGRRSS